jgi:TRAP-type C4-dicarboxylate transport system substrate-binding protein
MKGVKVAGAGTNLRYFDGVGGVGVSGSSVNYYNMLQTGVVNAAVLWTEGGMTFKLNEVAPHILNADLGPVNSKVVTVNKDVWAKLPPEVRQVLVEVARDYRDRLADVAMARAKDSKAKFTAAGGTWVDLSPEARAAWAKSMPNMAKEWAARMDAKGLPGTDMLKHYMDRMRASGQKPVRDWDRE